MSKETNDYGFVAINEGDGEITLCDSMGGGVTLTRGPFLAEDIEAYIRSMASAIAAEMVDELNDEDEA